MTLDQWLKIVKCNNFVIISSQLQKWSIWRGFHLCRGELHSRRLPTIGRNSKVLPAMGSAADINRPGRILHQY